MIAIAPVLLRLPLRLALAVACSAGYCSAAAAAETPVAATPDSVPAPIRCRLESARLDFGQLHWPLRARYVGVGEIVASCHNPSGSTRRAELRLSFPTMGPQGVVLPGRHGKLAVSFYRDSQFAERWDENRNDPGILLELRPGEQRRLRLSVHAVMQADRQAGAGAYHTQLPITLAARSIPDAPMPR